jgi:hypothetical protein
MVNSRYFRSIKAKIASAASDLMEDTDSDLNSMRVVLFKAFMKWLEDDVVLRGNVHLSSLSTVYMPDKLTQCIGEYKVI